MNFNIFFTLRDTGAILFETMDASYPDVKAYISLYKNMRTILKNNNIMDILDVLYIYGGVSEKTKRYIIDYYSFRNVWFSYNLYFKFLVFPSRKYTLKSRFCAWMLQLYLNSVYL